MHAHSWSPRLFQWINIGTYSYRRKAIEGALGVRQLKGQKIGSSLPRNEIEHFQALGKQFEEESMTRAAVPWSQPDLGPQANLLRKTPLGHSSTSSPYDYFMKSWDFDASTAQEERTWADVTAGKDVTADKEPERVDTPAENSEPVPPGNNQYAETQATQFAGSAAPAVTGDSTRIPQPSESQSRLPHAIGYQGLGLPQPPQSQLPLSSGYQSLRLSPGLQPGLPPPSQSQPPKPVGYQGFSTPSVRNLDSLESEVDRFVASLNPSLGGQGSKPPGLGSSWLSPFKKPKPEYVDTSPGGNNSFFEDNDKPY